MDDACDMGAIYLLSLRCSYEDGIFCKINILVFGLWSHCMFGLEIYRIESRNALELPEIRSTRNLSSRCWKFII